MCSCYTLIYILAVASIRGEGVAFSGTCAVEAAWCVVASVRTYVSSSGQSTLVNVFTCISIHVTQLVASAAITLIGAINIGTLLTAGAALALIKIITVPSITGQLEACGAAALVGAQNIIALVCTQATREMPAFINILTDPGDAVKGEATPAFTAVGAHQINATMTSTGIIWACTLINIHATCALLIKVVATTTAD